MTLKSHLTNGSFSSRISFAAADLDSQGMAAAAEKKKILEKLKKTGEVMMRFCGMIDSRHVRKEEK